MKKSELKEYIKKSILEGDYLEDDPKAIDAMDDAMVQDYEEEEEPNKYALDKEEPLEEAKISPDNRVAYLENILDMIWKRGRGNNTVDFKSLAQSAINDMFDEEPMEEDVIAEADKIVESWSKKKILKEADLSQANFSDLHQVVKNIAHVNGIEMEEAAMQAIEYIAEQFDVPVDFRNF